MYIFEKIINNKDMRIEQEKYCEITKQRILDFKKDNVTALDKLLEMRDKKYQFKLFELAFDILEKL